MKYLLLFCDDESMGLTPEQIAVHPGHQGWLADATRRRQYVTGGRLRPSASATSVRVRDGETLVSDGPFAETKDFIGGFAIVECADLDDAAELAARHPVAVYGTVEVRPLWEA